jgi:hypothetical protein
MAENISRVANQKMMALLAERIDSRIEELEKEVSLLRLALQDADIQIPINLPAGDDPGQQKLVI